MRSLGVDIGTTTLSAIVLNYSDGNVVESVTLPNAAWIKSGEEFESLQSPQSIVKEVVGLIDMLAAKYAPIACIGLTGQMHGIVYVDDSGKAAGPLYTWQDRRGMQIDPKSGNTYVETLSELTNQKGLASGYGMVTHYYNTTNGLVPPHTATYCTIADYVGMCLCGAAFPYTHASNGASFGLFDLRADCFDEIAVRKAGIAEVAAPHVTSGYGVIGKTKAGIPVSVAIGDNQASFIGL